MLRRDAVHGPCAYLAKQCGEVVNSNRLARPLQLGQCLSMDNAACNTPVLRRDLRQYSQ
jgi:hypothetical protein